MFSTSELYKLKDFTIGEKIKWLREHKPKPDGGFMTTQDLATELHKSSSTINKLENNADCKISTLIDVAEYFEVSIDWLLSRPKVSEAYCELHSVCKYTGLDVDTIDFLSDKNTERIFKEFIDFIVAYARENHLFINELDLIKQSAQMYQSQIFIEKALMRVYESNGNIDDDIKEALYKIYKNDILKQDDATRIKLFTILRSNYISDKYEFSERMKDIINEFSVSGLYTEQYDYDYSYDDLKNDEKALTNSKYFIQLSKQANKKRKDGENDETKEEKS